MTFDELKAYVIKNQKELMIGFVAGFFVRTMMRR